MPGTILTVVNATDYSYVNVSPVTTKVFDAVQIRVATPLVPKVLSAFDPSYAKNIVTPDLFIAIVEAVLLKIFICCPAENTPEGTVIVFDAIINFP